MNRCLCTEKMSVNFLLLFRAEIHNQTMMGYFLLTNANKRKKETQFALIAIHKLLIGHLKSRF